MSLEINLLAQKQTLSPSFLRLSETIRRISLALLLLFILTTATVYSLGMFLNSQTAEIQNRIVLTKKLIEEAKGTESVYLAYAQKMQAIDELIKERIYPSDYFRKIKQALPADLLIPSFSLDHQSITFSVEFSSLESLEGIISGLQTKLEIPTEEIFMSGLERAEDKYQVNFQILLETYEKKEAT